MLCQGPTSSAPSALGRLPTPGSTPSGPGGSSTTAAAACAPRPSASSASHSEPPQRRGWPT
eukprot:361762-Pyramimonas_sp.AAC.1